MHHVRLMKSKVETEMTINRRQMLVAGTAMSMVGLNKVASAQSTTSIGSSPDAGKARVVLLGTAGGPSPKVSRAAPSSMVAVGGSLYVIDCGNGVARQIVRAGFTLKDLKGIFITHQHSDHNLDYGNLFYLAWSAALKNTVNSYGPPPLSMMTNLF